MIWVMSPHSNRIAIGGLLAIAALSLTLLGACSKGQPDDVSSNDLPTSRDGFVPPDSQHDDFAGSESRPSDGPRPDRPVSGDISQDTTRPDTMAPDTMAPDTMAPDTMAPDTMAPDTMPPGVLGAPFTLDFEANNGGLKGTLDWEWGKLAFAPPASGSNCDTTNYYAPKTAHSGTSLWGTILNDCHNGLANAGSTNNCTNLTTQDDSVLTLKVAIPGTWSTATLGYWQWIDAFMNYDWGEVRINGALTQQFCSETTPGPPGSEGAWAKVSVDLTSYKGKTITIAFHFVATNVVNLAGWYVDDLSVTGH